MDNIIQLRPGSALQAPNPSGATILSPEGASALRRALSVLVILLNREIDSAEEDALLGLASQTELEEVRARIRGHRETVDAAWAYLR